MELLRKIDVINCEIVDLNKKILSLQESLLLHPTYIQPTLSLSSSQSANDLEIGQTVNIPLSVTFTQNDAGAASGTVIKKDGSTISTLNNFTDSSVVLTELPKIYQATVSYGEGPIKRNSLLIEDSIGQIQSGSLSSNILTYRGYYRYFFGPVSNNPSDSAAVRALDNQLETSGIITLNTGTISSKFALWIPATHYLVKIVDVDANNTDITSQYTLINSSFSVNDAGGNPIIGKLYVLTQNNPYNTSHSHRIAVMNGASVVDYTEAEKLKLASLSNIDQSVENAVLNLLGTDTQQDISSLSIWDFDLGEWAIVNANSNKSYTISNIPTPGAGIMHFTQDSTGGRTLLINGVNIGVISTPLSTTRVEISIVGSTIVYTTSSGVFLSGLVTLQQLATPVLVGGTATLTTVPLSWAGIANNAGYQIQRSIDNSVWVTVLNAPTNTLSYLVSPLTPGTTWYLRIRAIGDNATFINSEWSNVVTKTTTGSNTMLLADDFEDNKKDTSKWIYVDTNQFLIETLGSLRFNPTGGVITGVDYTTTNNSMASQAQFVDSFLALRFDLQMGVAEQFRIGLYTSGFGSFANGGLQIVTTGGVGVLLLANYNAGPSAANSFTTSFSNTDNVNRSYKITINKSTQVGKVYWWSSGAWVQLGSDFTTFQSPDRVCISVARASTNIGANIIDNMMLTNTDFTTLNPS